MRSPSLYQPIHFTSLTFGDYIPATFWMGNATAMVTKKRGLASGSSFPSSPCELLSWPPWRPLALHPDLLGDSWSVWSLA